MEVKQLYFAWTGFQRRQISLAPHFGFENVFMPVERRVSLLRKAFSYLKNTRLMFRRLRLSRPEVVWVQLPQVPLLWVVLFYRWFIDGKVKVIADCHNAMFRAPWNKIPFGVSLLSRCDVVLVHNDDVRRMALEAKLSDENLLVVEDPPASFGQVELLSFDLDMPRPWFVFPASFSPDEPISELIDAARKVSNVSVLITGNFNNCKNSGLIQDAPPNVRFMGFLSVSDFDALIVHCDAVIAFTRFDGIQLSVCGEAVGAGKPMLVSETTTLKRLFPKGSVFVDSSDAHSIANGIGYLTENSTYLSQEMRGFRDEITSAWIEERGKLLLSRVV